MFNTVETKTFSNIAATTATFTLRGGQYGCDVVATGAGSVTLQKLAGDGVTFVTCMTAFATTAGYATANLPSGTYRFTVVTFTAIFIQLTSIVTTM